MGSEDHALGITSGAGRRARSIAIFPDTFVYLFGCVTRQFGRSGKTICLDRVGSLREERCILILKLRWLPPLGGRSEWTAIFRLKPEATRSIDSRDRLIHAVD
jgi:hypothetical protein